MSEEYLRGMQIVLAKTGFVSLHQSHLSHRSCGLQLMHGVRTLAPIEALHALGNSAAGDEDDFFTEYFKLADLLRPLRQCGMIKSLAAIGDQAATDFND